jgi:uncharacterized glyoxalase superfamily protein PhnB
MKLLELRPMLEVQNMDQSIDFYEKKLGFSCINRMGDDWARLQRDQVGIMLSRRFTEKKQPEVFLTGSLYIYTDAVDQLWEEWKDRVTVSYPIETFDYDLREFGILDCNGYLLQFGQEIA